MARAERLWMHHAVDCILLHLKILIRFWRSVMVLELPLNRLKDWLDQIMHWQS